LAATDGSWAEQSAVNTAIIAVNKILILNISYMVLVFNTHFGQC